LFISFSQWLIRVAGQITKVVGMALVFEESKICSEDSDLIEFIRSRRKAIVVTVFPSLQKEKREMKILQELNSITPYHPQEFLQNNILHYLSMINSLPPNGGFNSRHCIQASACR
jgi:hypothetical protein